jgi:beta-lactamase regulating signal transducer with metallopeptidase domain
VDSLFWQAVVVQLLQVTLLIGIVGLVSHLMRHRYPHVVYGLWCVVFIKCLTPPLIPAPFGLFSWQQPVFFADAMRSLPAPARDSNRTERTSRTPRDTAGIVLVSVDDCEVQLAETAPVPSSPESAAADALTVTKPGDGAQLSAEGTPGILKKERSLARFMLLAVIVWLAGFLIVLGRGAIQWRAFYRAMRIRQVPVDPWLEMMHCHLNETICPDRKVKLLVTDQQFGPMVAGWRRPIVVLPQSLLQRLTTGQAEMIVAHELVHVRRGDTLLGLLQYLTAAIWWFHPLVWWANRKTDELAERCCDLEVLGHLRCHPPAYVRSLLRVIEMRKQVTLIAGAAGVNPSNVTVDRLKWVAVQAGAAKPAGRSALLTAILAAMLVLPAAGFGMLQEHPRLNSPELQDVSVEREASNAYENRDFETAARLYGRLSVDSPHNGQVWARYANSLQKLGRHEESLVPFEKAAAIVHRGLSVTIMRWAGALCMTGDTEGALKRIAESLNAGFSLNESLTDNPLFAAIRENPDFIALAKRHDDSRQAARGKMQGLGLAPVEDPGSGVTTREIDMESLKRIAFLEGNWQVLDKEGQTVGSVEFTNDVKEQILLGSWKQGENEPVASRIFYDPRGDIWIMNQEAGGSSLNLAGSLDQQNRSLVLEGFISDSNGVVIDCKWELSRESEGKLLMRKCTSEDGGGKWSDWELRYLTRANGQ